MARGTPIRNVRIPDNVWEPAKAKADAEHPPQPGLPGGISEVIRRALTDYIKPDTEE